MIEKFRRKLHCPGHLGWPTVKLPVYEVGQPAEKQAQGCNSHQVVTNGSPGKMMPLVVDPHENNQSKNAFVTGHPAVPDPKDTQGVLGQHIGLIEQYISEATAHQ